jgi:hypothetical protein
MAKYENRYGDTYTFTKQEDGNVLWEGNFEHCRFGYDKDPSDPIFIDPSGGPFIKKGQMLAHIVYDDEFNVIIDGFERVENGYLIKTIEHIVDPDDMSHLADTKIIGGIINTTEK